MKSAERTQYDDLQELYSEKSGLDCSQEIDTARQEFKEEADTNKIMQRFGVNVPQKPIQFGEQFDIELQDALEAVRSARKAYRELPPDVRKEYPSWRTLLENLMSGKLSLDKKEEKSDRADTPKPTEDKK